MRLAIAVSETCGIPKSYSSVLDHNIRRNLVLKTVKLHLCSCILSELVFKIVNYTEGALSNSKSALLIFRCWELDSKNLI